MLCEPGFNSMGFSSLWEGSLQAGWGRIQNGAEGRQKHCLLAAVAAAIVPPPQGKGGTAVGELMWIAK